MKVCSELDGVQTSRDIYCSGPCVWHLEFLQKLSKTPTNGTNRREERRTGATAGEARSRGAAAAAAAGTRTGG